MDIDEFTETGDEKKTNKVEKVSKYGGTMDRSHKTNKANRKT